MLSLTAALKTCKADAGWANKFQSDRVLNPSNMVCPPWDNVDGLGRNAGRYSFKATTAGCNSSLDRVGVENQNRPKYFDNVSLSDYGLELPCEYSYGTNYNELYVQSYTPSPIKYQVVPDNMARTNRRIRDAQFQKLSYRIMENRKLSGC